MTDKPRTTRFSSSSSSLVSLYIAHSGPAIVATSAAAAPARPALQRQVRGRLPSFLPSWHTTPTELSSTYLTHVSLSSHRRFQALRERYETVTTVRTILPFIFSSSPSHHTHHITSRRLDTLLSTNADACAAPARSYHIDTHELRPRSPTRNRKRAAPPSRNQVRRPSLPSSTPFSQRQRQRQRQA